MQQSVVFCDLRFPMLQLVQAAQHSLDGELYEFAADLFEKQWRAYFDSSAIDLSSSSSSDGSGGSSPTLRAPAAELALAHRGGIRNRPAPCYGTACDVEQARCLHRFKQPKSFTLADVPTLDVAPRGPKAHKQNGAVRNDYVCFKPCWLQPLRHRGDHCGAAVASPALPKAQPD